MGPAIHAGGSVLWAGAIEAAPRGNMLLKGATRMGITAIYTPASKYKVYWALILAEPDEKKS